MFLATDDIVDHSIHDIRAALGKEPVDLLIRGVTLLNVYSEEAHPADIAIRRHRIVAIRENFDGDAHQVIDAAGLFAMPGAIEPLRVPITPNLRERLIRRGITSVIVDADHAPELGDLSVWQIGKTAKPIQPDAIVGTSGAALERLREGTIPIIDAGLCEDWTLFFAEITERGIVSSRFILSQMARAENPVAAAIAAGQKPAKARQLVSFNAAIHYSLDHEIGGIAPGRQADIVLSSSPSGEPSMVIARGKTVFRV